MNRKFAGPALRLAALAFLVVFALTMPTFAHGGFEHVAGNVVQVTNGVMSFRTSTGIVYVKLDATTEITRDKVKAQVADLVPGTRVVVDIPEGSNGGNAVAHAVKISNTAPAAHDSH
jgi:hypothetical protein